MVSRLRLFLVILFCFAAGCSSGGGGDTSTPGRSPGPVGPSSVTPVSVRIEPNPLEVPTGLDRQAQAFVFFSDGTRLDVTSQVNWSTRDASVASVDGGLVHGNHAGSTTLVAAYAGISTSGTVQVTNAVLQRIELTPASVQVPRGIEQQVVATGTFSDGSQFDISGTAQWSSADDNVATVAGGAVKGVNAGSTRVTASLQGLSASAVVQVTNAVLTRIELSPPSVSLPKGLVQTFTATGIFSDQTSLDVTAQVQWTYDSTILSFSNNVARGIREGLSGVTAGLNGVSSNTAQFNVTQAALVSLVVTPGGLSLPAGTRQQMTARATYTDESVLDVTTSALWSAGSQLALISNANGSQGSLRALEPGVVTVSASLGAASGSVDVTISDATLELLRLEPQVFRTYRNIPKPFRAIGFYSDHSRHDLTREVVWSSSDPQLASVSNAAGTEGVVEGLRGGAGTISADLNGTTATCSLQISTASPGSIRLSTRETETAVGYNTRVRVSAFFTDFGREDITEQSTLSVSGNVAAVSNTAGLRGVLIGTHEGRGEISYSALGLHNVNSFVNVYDTPLLQLSVLEPEQPLIVPLARQLVAIGTFARAGYIQDLTRQVEFFSLTPDQISVTPQGEVRARFPGSATVRVARTPSLTNEIGLTVSSEDPPLKWTLRQAPHEDYNHELQSIAYGNGRFVATGDIRQTSTDGITWSAGTPNEPRIGTIIFDGTQFVGLSDGVFTSPDGENWTQRLSRPYLREVAYGNGHWVASGDSGAVYSDNLTNWYDSAFPAFQSSDLGSLCFAQGRFVIPRFETVLSSEDGADFQSNDRMFNDKLSLAFGAGRWVNVGLYRVEYSTNLRDWSWVQGHGKFSSRMKFLNGMFWEYTQEGTLEYSPDGLNWYPVPKITDDYLRDIAFGAGRLVVVGQKGAILTYP